MSSRRTLDTLATPPTAPSASPPWPAHPPLRELLMAAAAYGLLAYVAIVIARQPGSIATLWPATGVAVGLIASAPLVRLPALLAACMAGNLAANLLHGDAPAVALAFLLPNALDAALGGWLLHRHARADRITQGHRELLKGLLWGALVPPIAGATLGAGLLHALDFAAFGRVWLDWYIGASAGTAAMLPLVLSLRARPPGLRDRLSEPTSLLALAAAMVLCALALHVTPYPFVVISIALVMLAFLQPRLVSFAGSPLVMLVMALTLATGWFTPTTPDSPLGHALVYGSMLMVVVTAQVVAVVVAEQRTLARLIAALGSRQEAVVVLLDMDGIYRWVNRAREDYTGVPSEATIGHSLVHNMRQMSPEGLAEVVNRFERARGRDGAGDPADVVPGARPAHDGHPAAAGA